MSIFIVLKTRKKYLVVIAGATAVGKTDLAIELAKHYKTVVVSADSRQIYKEMKIGTACPDANQLLAAPHYFIGNRSIEELYGAGHFASDAQKLLETLFQTHDIVIMAGGSGLYIDAVLNGVDEFDEVPAEIRERLNAAYSEKGLTWLQAQIREKDAVYAAEADLSNPQRLIRALEVIEHTGKAFSAFRKKTVRENNFIALKILVNTKRETLYERINKRVDLMMANGLLEEVKSLSNKQHLNALKTVGYRELFEYLNGICSLEEAITKIKQHTRNYAKRQLTWFRNRDNFKELPVENSSAVINYINEQIQQHERDAV